MTRIPAVGPATFKNILFVTDFSSSSEIALPHAVALAAGYEGKVYIGHVITPQLYDLVPPDLVPEVLRQSAAYAQRRMKRLVKAAQFGDTPYETLIERGELWETLRRLTDEYAIDLVALGTGGRRGLHEVLMGAVAEEVLRLARVPVLTVGPESREPPLEGEPRSILLANDFSGNCLCAVACADSLARKFKARLVSTYVAPESAEDPESASRLEQLFLERLERSLNVAAFEDKQLDFRVDIGIPADSILKFVAEHDADLIVMGVRGAGTLARPSCHLGKTTYHVVSQARCPVLAVPG